jgi:hypothetical protein
MDTICLEALLDDIGKADELRHQTILHQYMDGSDRGVLGELPNMQVMDL